MPAPSVVSEISRRRSLTAKRFNFETWHYADSKGDTHGPFGFRKVCLMYEEKELTEGHYMWNGLDVTNWTPLRSIPELLHRIKEFIADDNTSVISEDTYMDTETDTVTDMQQPRLISLEEAKQRLVMEKEANSKYLLSEYDRLTDMLQKKFKHYHKALELSYERRLLSMKQHYHQMEMYKTQMQLQKMSIDEGPDMDMRTVIETTKPRERFDSILTDVSVVLDCDFSNKIKDENKKINMISLQSFSQKIKQSLNRLTKELKVNCNSCKDVFSLKTKDKDKSKPKSSNRFSSETTMMSQEIMTVSPPSVSCLSNISEEDRSILSDISLSYHVKPSNLSPTSSVSTQSCML